MNVTDLVKAAVSVTVASALLKFGNENYEMLKAEGGLIAPFLCLLGGIALGIYALKCFGRAFLKA